MQPAFDGDTRGHLSRSALPGDPHSLCYTFLPINFFREGLYFNKKCAVYRAASWKQTFTIYLQLHDSHQIQKQESPVTGRAVMGL